MEPLTIETFNPDMIKVINSEQKRAAEINYTLVKFSYDRGKIPLLRIDGKFRLFRFKNPRGGIYSLSIRCNGLFHFLSIQGDGRKKFKSIFALDFFDMNISSPGKQLGEFLLSLEFHSE